MQAAKGFCLGKDPEDAWAEKVTDISGSASLTVAGLSKRDVLIHLKWKVRFLTGKILKKRTLEGLYPSAGPVRGAVSAPGQPLGADQLAGPALVICCHVKVELSV